jgi:predicted nuclease of predicted toxin-antitoxin system
VSGASVDALVVSSCEPSISLPVGLAIFLQPCIKATTCPQPFGISQRAKLPLGVPVCLHQAMPDKRSRLKARHRREWLQTPSRRLRLYSDEDLPSRAIEMLRLGGAKVLTTNEAGNRGKDDRFQIAFAARTRRVLVTRNAKHFLDDRVLSVRATYGVIALELNDRSEKSYLSVTAIVAELIAPYAELYERMKIRVSSAGASFRFVDRTGAARTVNLSIDDLLDWRYPTEDEDRRTG